MQTLLIENFDYDSLKSLVQDLLNKEYNWNLEPPAESLINAPTFWQGDINSTFPRVYCEVSKVETKEFEANKFDTGRLWQIVTEFNSEKLILVVPRNLSAIQKQGLTQFSASLSLSSFEIIDLQGLNNLLEKHPDIAEMYREFLSSWHEAYNHIAHLLDEFHFIHNEFTPAKIYSILKSGRYEELNSTTLFNPELQLSEKGLDPIQIFATFNYARITHEKRYDVIEALLIALDSKKKLNPKISFQGIPSPIITRVINFRGWAIQNEIWNMFAKACASGFTDFKSETFAQLKNWRGIDIASFTMFLFWIDSEEFLPLDSNTVSYLRAIEVIKQRPKNFNSYYSLCREKDRLQKKFPQIETKELFRNLVTEAYSFGSKTTRDLTLSGTTETYIEIVTGERKERGALVKTIAKKRKEQFKNFKIIAVRPLAKSKPFADNSKQKHIKNLEEGKIYAMYQAYNFENEMNGEIGYDADLDINIFNSDELNISICAIVGMNGSGKSTIAELIFLIINRLSLEKKIKSTEKLKSEEVYAELFIKSDELYKISINDTIKVYRYKPDGEGKKYNLHIEGGKDAYSLKNFDIESLSYSIALNYSLHSLNSSIVGDWIDSLFHKNDSYQVPLVLNPKRDNGKIDINIENSLAKSRLLENLLEPRLIDFENKKIPALVPGSIPEQLILELDIEKIKRKRNKHKGEIKRENINKIINALGIIIAKGVEFEDVATEYIYLKVISIPYIYAKYKKQKNLLEWIDDTDRLTKYLATLKTDPSHISFKLKQTISYLEFNIYNTKSENLVITLADNIRKILATQITTPPLRTIDLIPPPFLQTNIKFTHNGKFDDLSSGERQQIYSINTIAYHLSNLKSVVLSEGILKYNSVNIIFDEVELYFHPDMQRHYINNLRDRILSLRLNENNDINNINIIFITHSPFILSDIPSANVLMLEIDSRTNLSKPKFSLDESFGANVHELLANDFFMRNGFVGEYSKQKITSLIDFFEGRNSAYDYHSSLRLINQIGDALIQTRLLDLHREKFKIEGSQDDSEYESWLKSEIERIRLIDDKNI